LAEGEKSLRLGQDLAWHRNTAFCLKCLGRLSRLRAEEANDTDEKREHLTASESQLKQAIESFSANVTEFGPKSSEVGDCYSLLARTYLARGDTVGATDAAKEAANRIERETVKDYADLQIVLGDLALAKGDRDAAVSFYSDAVNIADGDDAERSEIVARALLHLGRATSNNGALSRAADIWTRLDDSSAREQLMKAPSPVRVEAWRLHSELLASMTSKPLGRRSEPSAEYWRVKIAEATKNITVRRRDW
jgi:tetratricopeptide (TPR) repeat protein